MKMEVHDALAALIAAKEQVVDRTGWFADGDERTRPRS